MYARTGWVMSEGLVLGQHWTRVAAAVDEPAVLYRTERRGFPVESYRRQSWRGTAIFFDNAEMPPPAQHETVHVEQIGSWQLHPFMLSIDWTRDIAVSNFTPGPVETPADTTPRTSAPDSTAAVTRPLSLEPRNARRRGPRTNIAALTPLD